MSAADPRVQTAVAELANALQVAAPVAARMRSRLSYVQRVQTQDADTLAAALERAVAAIRQLQPTVTGQKGA